MRLKSRLKHISTLCLFAVVFGCAKAKVYYPDKGPPNATTTDIQEQDQIYRQKVKQLEHALLALDATVAGPEAIRVADTAVRESAILAEEYQLVRPAVAHNLLVALGIKDRGLCYHWTEDLMKRLQALDLKSLQLYWGVAHRGSELREHNCVVISAKGQDFCKGIVLDPWRNSGNLFWARVSRDSYPWKVLPPSDW
ncbi:MAG: hypothetical protein PVG06_06500 [Desulfobacterales bacterium]